MATGGNQRGNYHPRSRSSWPCVFRPQRKRDIQIAPIRRAFAHPLGGANRIRVFEVAVVVDEDGSLSENSCKRLGGTGTILRRLNRCNSAGGWVSHSSFGISPLSYFLKNSLKNSSISLRLLICGFSGMLLCRFLIRGRRFLVLRFLDEVAILVEHRQLLRCQLRQASEMPPDLLVQNLFLFRRQFLLFSQSPNHALNAGVLACTHFSVNSVGFWGA